MLNIQKRDSLYLPQIRDILDSLIHQLDTIKKPVPGHAVPQKGGWPQIKGQIFPVQISKLKVKWNKLQKNEKKNIISETIIKTKPNLKFLATRLVCKPDILSIKIS